MEAFQKTTQKGHYGMRFVRASSLRLEGFMRFHLDDGEVDGADPSPEWRCATVGVRSFGGSVASLPEDCLIRTEQDSQTARVSAR
jgi:hypothetical protein